MFRMNARTSGRWSHSAFRRRRASGMAQIRILAVIAGVAVVATVGILLFRRSDASSPETMRADESAQGLRQAAADASSGKRWHYDDAGGVVGLRPDNSIVRLGPPPERSPERLFEHCIQLLSQCGIAEDTNAANTCFARIRRCATKTPWLDDPAGVDCCPQKCMTVADGEKAKPDYAPSSVMLLVSESRCFVEQ